KCWSTWRLPATPACHAIALRRRKLSGGGSIFASSCPREEFAHFFVAGLGKIFVVLADRLEEFRFTRADDFVGLVFEFATRIRGPDSDRHADLAGAASPQRFHGSPHRRAGRQPISDKNDR